MSLLLNNYAQLSKRVYLGELYNKSSWTDLTDFINFMTPPAEAIVTGGNKINFGGGDATYNNFLAFPFYTALEKFTFEIDFRMDTIADFSYGIAGGLRGFSAVIQEHFAGQLVTIDVGDPSPIGKSGIAGGNAYALNAISDTGFAIADGERLRARIYRNGNIVTVTGFNLDSPATSTVTYTYIVAGTLQPSALNRFIISNVGGSVLIDRIYLYSHEWYKPAFCWVGDSKLCRYSTDNFSERFAAVASNALNKKFSVLGGAGENSSDMLNRLPEMLSLKAAQYIMCGCSNDPRQGISSATTISNYDTIVAALEGIGSRVVHTTGFYENSGNNQTPLQDHIIADYDSDYVVDTLPYVIGLHPDEVHPNTVGHVDIGEFIAASGKL